MDQNLAQIFKLRLLCLQHIRPDFYATNSKMIEAASFAAQEYYLSGAYNDEMSYSTAPIFRTQPKYIAVHQKYGLPYDPQAPQIYMGLNQGLVMDLADSFRKDKTNGLISPTGQIIRPAQLGESEILRVYHNSSQSGIPIDALRLMMPYQRNQILKNAMAKTK